MKLFEKSFALRSMCSFHHCDAPWFGCQLGGSTVQAVVTGLRKTKEPQTENRRALSSFFCICGSLRIVGSPDEFPTRCDTAHSSTQTTDSQAGRMLIRLTRRRETVASQSVCGWLAGWLPLAG
jgi:hypothetical protein